jgi:membrane-associated PAP2 superfamily phosphatase
MISVQSDLAPLPMTATAQAASPSAPSAVVDRVPRRPLDFVAVIAVWAVAVAAASAFPLDDPQLHRAALFIHLMSMAVGFGSVVMIDVYGLRWLFGQRTLVELVDLTRVAHGVISVGVGGLLASGIALRPELDTPLARLKMVLVLILMLNSVSAQRMLRRMRATWPPTTCGASIPWRGFQRALAAAVVSQATWWGAIAIGFITNANRTS